MEDKKSYSPKIIELMEWEPEKDKYSFTYEEVEFLAKEDLTTLAEPFPAEADYYMYKLS